MNKALVEANVHYVWLGKLPEGKDSIFGVLKSIARINQSTKDINDPEYGFKKFYIHTDNPENIKNAIDRYKSYEIFFAEITALSNLAKNIKTMKNTFDRLYNYGLHNNAWLNQYTRSNEELEFKLNNIKKAHNIIDNTISIDDICEIDTIAKHLNDAIKNIIINDINKDEAIQKKFDEHQYISGIYHRYKMQTPPQFAGMADCLRVVALNVYGGIYFDFDIGVPVIPSQERPDFMKRLIYDRKPSIMHYHDKDKSINNSIIMLNKDNNFLLNSMEETIKQDLITNSRNANPPYNPNKDEKFYKDMFGNKIAPNELCTPRSEFWFVLQNTGPAVSCYHQCNPIMPLNPNGTNYFKNDGSAPWSKRKRPRTKSISSSHKRFKGEIRDINVNNFEKSGFMTYNKTRSRSVY